MPHNPKIKTIFFMTVYFYFVEANAVIFLLFDKCTEYLVEWQGAEVGGGVLTAGR
jgi:hypothetical protein